jgi:Domain of unknown function (DUF6924)
MVRHQEAWTAPVIRTDFTDDLAWETISVALRVPWEEFDLVANVACVSDPRYDGLTVEQLTALAPQGPPYFMFVADQIAHTHPEHPLLVVDLNREPGRAFRTILSEVVAIEANLSLSNMDFFEFAESVDPDGIFRGFREP